jgi:DNA-binding MarR family transcriptional regulator
MRVLWQLNHALERISKSMASAIGVTAQQRMIVRCVGKYPGMVAGQLAAQLHVDAGTVSAALGRLERKGLLRRRRDGRDRRRVTLALTDAGRDVDRPDTGTVESAVGRLLEASAGEDLATTRRVLGSLTRLIDAESKRVRASTSR